MKLPKNGRIAGAAIVSGDSDVMLISTEGVVIRIPVKQISVIGRSTQGVTVMRLQKGVEVASLTVFNENGSAVDVLSDGADEIETPSSNGHGPRD